MEEIKLEQREKLAWDLIKTIVSTMKDWDLLHFGDYSPEEDTNNEVIVQRAFEITDLFLNYRYKGEKNGSILPE